MPALYIQAEHTHYGAKICAAQAGQIPFSREPLTAAYISRPKPLATRKAPDYTCVSPGDKKPGLAPLPQCWDVPEVGCDKSGVRVGQVLLVGGMVAEPVAEGHSHAGV